MEDPLTDNYFTRLLTLYEEKLKRFQLLLVLLLVSTVVFFFLIFFPYMTLLGNQEDCRVRQVQCTELEKSKLEERFSEVTTSWGNLPISTAEVTILFPVGISLGFFILTVQLQELIRLRRAVSQRLKAFSKQIDVTLIAPLLIDPKQSWIDQLSGGIVLLFPIFVFLYSVRLILMRLEILRYKLPYSQSTSFYYSIYLLSALLMFISLVRLVFSYVKAYFRRS